MASCTKKAIGPRDVLKKYVDYSFDGSVSKDQLLEITTGELSKSIEAMDEEGLKSFLKNSGNKQKKFKINHESCGKNKCNLTFTVAYVRQRNGKPVHVIEVREIAGLKSQNGKWLLEDIEHVKTYIDSKETISPE